MNTRHLFIGHSSACDDQRSRPIDLLRGRPDRVFGDYSVPKGDPIHGAPDATLRQASIRQIGS